jgi:hypothetical protein
MCTIAGFDMLHKHTKGMRRRTNTNTHTCAQTHQTFLRNKTLPRLDASHTCQAWKACMLLNTHAHTSNTHAHTHTLAHTQSCTHTHTHTHTYTHTHLSVRLNTRLTGPQYIPHTYHGTLTAGAASPLVLGSFLQLMKQEQRLTPMA